MAGIGQIDDDCVETTARVQQFVDPKEGVAEDRLDPRVAEGEFVEFQQGAVDDAAIAHQRLGKEIHQLGIEVEHDHLARVPAQDVAHRQPVAAADHQDVVAPRRGGQRRIGQHRVVDMLVVAAELGSAVDKEGVDRRAAGVVDSLGYGQPLVFRGDAIDHFIAVEQVLHRPRPIGAVDGGGHQHRGDQPVHRDEHPYAAQPAAIERQEQHPDT